MVPGVSHPAQAGTQQMSISARFSPTVDVFLLCVLTLLEKKPILLKDLESALHGLSFVFLSSWF